MTSTQPLHSFSLKTSTGTFLLHASEKALKSSGPILLLLHGAFRHAVGLLDLYRVLAKNIDCALIDLPGHGNSPAFGATHPSAMAQRLAEPINTMFKHRPVFIVGESAGGIVALELASFGFINVCGIVLGDVPLSPWNSSQLARSLIDAISRQADQEFAWKFSEDFFGIKSNEQYDKREYYELMKSVKIPMLALAGTRKNIDDGSLMTDEDISFIKDLNNPLISLEFLDAGHLIFNESTEMAAELITRFASSCLRDIRLKYNQS